MNVSIQSYQTNYLAKSPTLAKTSAEAAPKNDTSSSAQNSGDTITLSSSAKELYNLSSAAERQASMTPSELSRLYAKGQKDIYNFGQLLASGNYKEEDLLPKTDDLERLAIAQQALDYAIGNSQVPQKNIPNPFANMARNDLSAILYDDTDTYSIVERNAAHAELSKQDYEYFSQLFARTTKTDDRRELFKGILEYFDELPPVEKAAYPEGHRETMQNLLDKEIERWGPLTLLQLAAEEAAEEAAAEKRFESILNQEQTTAEMLQAILAKAQELDVTE